MSEVTDHNDPPGDDILAAEYVLGVLSQSERRAIERRIARDRVFASLVADWEAKLIPWAADTAPVQPPHQAWNRIESNLPAVRRDAGEWWANLGLWRGIAAGASAVALASVVALFVVLKGPAPQPLVATIEGGGHRHFIATIDGKRGTIAVVPAAYAADATRVPELWLISPGEKPRSLGLLNAQQAVMLTIPANMRASAAEQAVLAVSLEPPGGSKTGAPTGPVIAQGKLTNLLTNL